MINISDLFFLPEKEIQNSLGKTSMRVQTFLHDCKTFRSEVTKRAWHVYNCYSLTKLSQKI